MKQCEIGFLVLLVCVIFSCESSFFQKNEFSPIALIDTISENHYAKKIESLVNNSEYDSLTGWIDYSALINYVKSNRDMPLTESDVLLLKSIGNEVFIEMLRSHSKRGSIDRDFTYKYNYSRNGKSVALFLSYGDNGSFNYLDFETRQVGSSVKVVNFFDYLYQTSFLDYAYHQFKLLKKYGLKEGGNVVQSKRLGTVEKKISIREYEKAFQLLTHVPDEFKYHMPFRRSLMNLLIIYPKASHDKIWDRLEMLGAINHRSLLLVEIYRAMSTRDYEKCIEKIKKLESNFGLDLLICSLMADVEFMRGNFKQANSWYKSGAKIVPDFLYNYYGLLDVYVSQNKLKEASKIIEKLIQLGVDCKELNYYLTVTHDKGLSDDCTF